MKFYAGNISKSRQDTVRKSPIDADYTKRDDERTAKNSIYNSLDGGDDIYVYDEMAPSQIMK